MLTTTYFKLEVSILMLCQYSPYLVIIFTHVSISTLPTSVPCIGLDYKGNTYSVPHSSGGLQWWCPKWSLWFISSGMVVQLQVE